MWINSRGASVEAHAGEKSKSEPSYFTSSFHAFFVFFGFLFLHIERKCFASFSADTELQQWFRFSQQSRKRRDVNQDRQPLTAIPQRLVSNRCATWQLCSPENREPMDFRVVFSRAALPIFQHSSCPPKQSELPHTVPLQSPSLITSTQGSPDR